MSWFDIGHLDMSVAAGYPRYIIIDNYAEALRAEAKARRHRLGVSSCRGVVPRTNGSPVLLPITAPAMIATEPVLKKTEEVVDGWPQLPMTPASGRGIIAIAADLTAVSAWLIVSPRRDVAVCKARNLAFHIARHAIAKASYHWLGEQFNRDHSTVLHGLGVVERRITEYAELIDAAKARI